MTALPAPSFSVAMATYNGSRHLPEQLASIAGQSHPPAQLVVCDDASRDSTLEILRTFARTSPFPVHVTEQAANRGSRVAFERAISLCTGDWVALCDQDDLWHPEKLATLARAAIEHPRAGALFSDGDVVDDAGRPLGYTLWESVGFDASPRTAFARCPARVLLAEWVVTGAALAFHAQHRDLVLPFPDESAHLHHPLVHDAWIAVLIACVADVVPVPDRLIQYRVHEGQQKGVGTPEQATSLREPVTDLRSRVIGNLPELETLVERLGARGYSEADLTPAGMDVKERLRHFRARANMPRHRHRRIPVVAQEAGSGRYSRHSRGLRSALKDLLSPG